MTEPLTPRDRVVLMALMALNKDVTNAVLKEEVGFTLEGSARKRLNDNKMVSSSKRGRAYVHELTDEGWAWCWDELAEPTPAGADSGTRSLYAVLRGLRRYLDSANLRLADVFGLTETTLEGRLRAAYADLARREQDWVSLTAIRAHLRGVPREDLDALLVRLDAVEGGAGIDLVPQADQGKLTRDDRAAAIRIGNQDKHLLRLGTA